MTVYRMHPLIPDEYTFRSAADDRDLLEAGFREVAGPAAQRCSRSSRSGDLFYTFGTTNPGAIVLHNYPEVPAGVPATGNGHAHGHRGHRHPAGARARRAPLQRVPAAPAPRAGGHVRGAHRQPGVGRRDPVEVYARHRAGRSDGRDVRRAPARRVRLQRHGVSDLHPDGVAPPQQRPLPHDRFHAGGLHARSGSTGSRTTRWATCSCATTRSCALDARRDQRLQAVAGVGDGARDLPPDGGPTG